MLLGFVCSKGQVVSSEAFIFLYIGPELGEAPNSSNMQSVFFRGNKAYIKSDGESFRNIQSNLPKDVDFYENFTYVDAKNSWFFTYDATLSTSAFDKYVRPGRSTHWFLAISKDFSTLITCKGSNGKMHS